MNKAVEAMNRGRELGRLALKKRRQEVAGVLTAQMEVFCHCIARGMTQTAAAIEGGWAATSAAARGNRLMKLPAVVARVAELRKVVVDQRIQAVANVEMPHREGILRDLVATRDMATRQNNLMARLKANEMLGKELGMFRQSVDMAISSPLDGMGRDQLLALAALFRPGGARLIEGNVVEIDDVSRETIEDDDPLA